MSNENNVKLQIYENTKTLGNFEYVDCYIIIWINIGYLSTSKFVQSSIFALIFAKSCHIWLFPPGL